jgi:hypothetical protein
MTANYDRNTSGDTFGGHKRLAQLRSIERSYTVCVVAVIASAVIETTQISGEVPENISRVPERSEQAPSVAFRSVV